MFSVMARKVSLGHIGINVADGAKYLCYPAEKNSAGLLRRVKICFFYFARLHWSKIGAAAIYPAE